MIKQIVSEFQTQVKTIFHDKLIFAFICGGFAKGYADSEHDIDMFICVSQRCPYEESVFRDWYFQLHEKFNLPPDYKEPGEIMDIAGLEEKINFLEKLTIELEIESYYAYEAIVWGDILSGTIIGSVGDVKKLHIFQKKCRKYPDKWRKQILEKLPKKIGEDELNTPISLLFEKFVTYHKRKDVFPNP